jgi:hypothetical protein
MTPIASATNMDDRDIPPISEAKSEIDEAFLTQLNEALAIAKFEDDGQFGFDKPIVYIVGAPRSGTTLAYQILAKALPFSYVTNIAARFWRRPSIGIRLSRILLGDQAHKMIAFNSDGGVSQGVAGPHEFGYFWNHWFHYDLAQTSHLNDDELSRVDLNALQAALRYEILAHVANGFIFKSLPCGFQAKTLTQLHPQSVFCHIIRDEYCTAASILTWRKRYHGSYGTWFSLKPRSYPLEHLRSDPPLQVLEQIRSIKSELHDILSQPGINSLTMPYECMCRDPFYFISVVCERIKTMGYEVSPRSITFPQFRERPVVKLPYEYARRLEELCRSSFTQ